MASSVGANAESRANAGLEDGEWYVLVNRLRKHGNRLYYVRPGRRRVDGVGGCGGR